MQDQRRRQLWYDVVDLGVQARLRKERDDTRDTIPQLPGTTTAGGADTIAKDTKVDRRAVYVDIQQ